MLWLCKDSYSETPKFITCARPQTYDLLLYMFVAFRKFMAAVSRRKDYTVTEDAAILVSGVLDERLCPGTPEALADALCPYLTRWVQQRAAQQPARSRPRALTLKVKRNRLCTWRGAIHLFECDNARLRNRLTSLLALLDKEDSFNTAPIERRYLCSDDGFHTVEQDTLNRLLDLGAFDCGNDDAMLYHLMVCSGVLTGIRPGSLCPSTRSGQSQDCLASDDIELFRSLTSGDALRLALLRGLRFET